MGWRTRAAVRETGEEVGIIVEMEKTEEGAVEVVADVGWGAGAAFVVNGAEYAERIIGLELSSERRERTKSGRRRCNIPRDRSELIARPRSSEDHSESTGQL